MKKKPVVILTILFLMYVCSAEAFIDDFGIDHDFVADGMTGTGWDGYNYQGGILGSLVIEASGGSLRLQSESTKYDPDWDTTGDGTRDQGPVLYVNQSGDFVAITRLSGIIGTATAEVYHNFGGLIARDADMTNGENAILQCYFPVWTGFISWNIIDDARPDQLGQLPGDRTVHYNQVEQYSFMKLERIGSEFHFFLSEDGVNWFPQVRPNGLWDGSGTQTPLVIDRTDMPADLQVGLVQSTANTTLGWLDYDFLYVGRQVASVTGDATVTEAGETSVTLTINLTGPAPTAQVDVEVIPYALPYGQTPDTNDPNDILLVGSAMAGMPLTVTIPSPGTQGTFQIQAVDDILEEGTEQIGLKVLTYSADANYDQQLGQWILVTVVDDDAAGLSVQATGGMTQVSENGDTDTVDIALATRPDSNVTVEFSDPGGQVELSPAELTFTPDDWNVGKPVTISAVNDSDAEEDPHTANVRFSLSSSDTSYNGLTVPDLAVGILENDCGAWPYLPMDRNEDCLVNLADFAEFARLWLACTMPNDPACADLR